MDSTTAAGNSVSAAVVLFAGTTVIGALYTFVVVLYCLAARLSYSQLWNPDGKMNRKTVITFTVASLMMICATVDLVLTSIERQITYVDYGALPGGPLGSAASLHATAATRGSHFVLLINYLLITGVLVWRVIVIWRGNRFIKPVTLLLYVIYMGLATTNYASQFLSSKQLTGALTVPRIVRIIFVTSTTFGTAFLMFMSSLLIIRLLSVRWQHIEVMGKTESSDQYLGIVAILVESYTLETVWNIGFCIFCGLNLVPVDNFFDVTVVQVDVIANLLVIYRVLSGRSWNTQAANTLSTMQWGRNVPSPIGSVDAA